MEEASCGSPGGWPGNSTISGSAMGRRFNYNGNFPFLLLSSNSNNRVEIGRQYGWYNTRDDAYTHRNEQT